MIAYLESNGEDKEIVFAQVLGERNEVRKNIDGSKYGNFIDKYCLRKYLSEAMLLNYSGFNESMYCHPSDILENIELDFDKLEEIFNDSDYDNFIKTAYVYANRLLMLKLDIMPIVKFKEISRVKYNEDKNYDEVFLNSLNLNSADSHLTMRICSPKIQKNSYNHTFLLQWMMKKLLQEMYM